MKWSIKYVAIIIDLFHRVIILSTNTNKNQNEILTQNKIEWFNKYYILLKDSFNLNPFLKWRACHLANPKSQLLDFSMAILVNSREKPPVGGGLSHLGKLLFPNLINENFSPILLTLPIFFYNGLCHKIYMDHLFLSLIVCLVYCCTFFCYTLPKYSFHPSCSNFIDFCCCRYTNMKIPNCFYHLPSLVMGRGGKTGQGPTNFIVFVIQIWRLQIVFITFQV